MKPNSWPKRISLAVLACGLLAVGIGVALLWGPNDDNDVEPADRATEPAGTTPGPASTTTPIAATEPWLTGRIVIAGDVSLPAELALLTGSVPFGKGGISAWGVTRASPLLAGERGDAAIGGPNPSDGPGLSFAQDESGTVFASICQPVACASEGWDPATIFTTTFYRSDDGGLSWREVGSRPGQWFVRAALDGEPVAVNFEGNSTWVRVLSNRTVARPESAGQLGLVVFRGQLGWLSGELPMIVSESGATLYKLDLGQGLDARIHGIVAPSGGDIAVFWRDAGDPGRWFITVESPGQERWTVEITNGSEAGGPAATGLYGFTSASSSSDPLLLVAGATLAYPGSCPEGQLGYGTSPALLDISAGRLSFISDLLVDPACPAGGTVAFASWSGRLAAVATPDSCLNVRERPSLSGRVVECVADTVLVQLTGAQTAVDGVDWHSVRTLVGVEGWVAQEFLSMPTAP